ncbi:tetratricopeptide repeat protein [Polyangium mundeleinium]|uniref:Tetratricopeptide repeat protein n=1 Tax=Polyangium mundeleinium TaxID=2995306 RepID=A0ABT5EEM6_9BACT|nr:tetratricopeptide repeat protein [Polyangium mundeleinium]MDC0740267.1 tetratricopeptide repeat protein [Polyangium mundeleinium]
MVLTKAGLNRLFAEVLPQDADVEAFVAQNFGTIARRVARGADRAGKIALLVDNADLKVLLDKISGAHPVAVARNEHLLAEDKRVAGTPVPDAGPCVGRDALLAELAAHVHRDAPGPVLLVGDAGLGKTTLALALLHADASVRRFGGRRYVAHLDTAADTEAAVVEVSRALGVTPEAPLLNRIAESLRRAPALIVLDDLDVPLAKDPANVRDLLQRLTAIPGVAVIATSRSSAAPPDGFHVAAVKPLDEASARAAFLAIAGDARRSDPGLSFALTEAAGNPLALALLARAAGDGPLDLAVRAWHQKQNELLMREDGPESASAIEIAVALALASGRLSDEARRLAPLFAALPNGVRAEDLAAFASSGTADAGAALVALGLAQDASGRSRLRRAVREIVALQRPGADESAKATQRYTGLALSNGPNVGWPAGDESAARLAADSDNIEAMILRGIDGPHRIACIDASVALATFIGSSGHCTPRVVERARDAAREGGDKLGEADCTQALGDIALARGEVDEARARYLDALPLFHQARAGLSIAACLMRLGDIASERDEYDEAKLRYTDAAPYYRHIGDKLGEANCLRNLAEIAALRDDYEESRARYKEALPIYNELGDKAASANCMKGIADIAFQGTQYDEARALYQEVGPLLEELGDRLSMAQCLQNLGDIAFALGEHSVAEKHYQKALPILKELGDKLAEGTCLSTLGDVALACTEIEDAQAYYLAALPLLREVGEKMGEANCIQSLGDIALTQFEHDAARSHYENALGLFAALKDDYSIGWTHYRLAQVAADPDIFKNHLYAARDAWLRIGRQDLIDDVNTEFPGIL